MNKQRVSLLESFKDTVLHFKTRGTVGRIATEHSIFLPSKVMIDNSRETDQFVKAARYIARQEQWNLPVTVEKVTVMGTAGVEFIFDFNSATDFDAIVEELEGRI